MVCSLKIGESNKLIGWVYESNREKVKQAQKDLDDFYRDDALNDLQQTKDKELEILDERINNWNKYLTALKQRYDAWQVQEEQKLLMELTNAKTEEELYQKILDDMLNYNEKAAGHYDDYIGIFEDFLDDYKTNLEKLQELKELEREYMSPDYYLGANNGNFNNRIGALIRAIENNWTRSKNSSSVSNFNNFEPRQYDYEDLEKKLLGWDKDDEENKNAS